MNDLREYDIVVLVSDIPELGLIRGTRGTVLQIYSDPSPTCLVEFVNEKNLSLGTPIVEVSLLEKVGDSKGST